MAKLLRRRCLNVVAPAGLAMLLLASCVLVESEKTAAAHQADAAGRRSIGTTGQPRDQELRAFLERTIAQSHSFEDRYAAEVWLVDMSTRLQPLVPDADKRLELLRQIHAAATVSGLPPELVLAVIEVESHFDRFAVSSAGAQGMMQVMPFWREEIGRSSDNLTDNPTNFTYGCRILQFYLERENGALHRALAAYNGSSGSRRYSNKVKRAWEQRWKTAPLDWSD
ncbi:MAG: lytic transglycosylase domain-containing protein [Pseudomonadota bacterium]